mgnify:CR=1 FL=1
MDFELSEEQQLLKDMVARFMQDRYGFETRGKYMKEPLGFDPAIWEAYAEQGLLALPFAEEDGGIGGGGVEVMIVMEQMGHRRPAPGAGRGDHRRRLQAGLRPLRRPGPL